MSVSGLCFGWKASQDRNKVSLSGGNRLDVVQGCVGDDEFGERGWRFDLADRSWRQEIFSFPGLVGGGLQTLSF